MKAELKHPSVDSRVYSAVLLLQGLLFSATIIGLILGVPEIIIGLALLFAKDQIEGSCPHCNYSMSITAGKTQDNCPTCKSMVLYQNGYFYPLDSVLLSPDFSLVAKASK